MASRVFTVAERPFSDIPGVAIAITEVDDQQRHVGILHKEGTDGHVALLHLAWHLVLKNSDPGPHYAWVECSIHPIRAQMVAALCREVFRANERTLRYAFSPPRDCFDHDTGAYLFGPTQHGLTCSSFVLAVFHSAGLPLVRYDTWPLNRPGDDTWRERIIAALENPDLTHPAATTDHINAIRSQANSTRFRPEEVAGAAACEIPAAFAEASDLALDILRKLSEEELRLPQRT
jgi:hypothetical protein